MDIKNSFIVNQFIAHRGLHSKEFPENTLGAFEKAIEKNYAIELDVHLLADNTVIVFHDKTLHRMMGQDGYIENMTFEQIKDIKVGGTDYKIPTLKEVLKFVNGRVPVVIEIKNFSRKKIGTLESEVAKELQDYEGEYAVMSFNPFVIEWFKENHPKIMRGILATDFKNDSGDQKTSFFERFVLKNMLMNKKIKPDFVAYYYKAIPNRATKKYKNLPLIAWPVPSQEEYLKIIKHIDNIIFEGFEPKI